MKYIYQFTLLLLAVVSSGCMSTHIGSSVEEGEESIGHKMVYAGYELEKAHLRVSKYGEVLEPKLFLMTEFAEYERRVDEMKTFKRDVEKEMIYRTDLLDVYEKNPAIYLMVFPIPIIAAKDLLINIPFKWTSKNYRGTYKQVRTTRGEKYDFGQRTKEGPRKKKYSPSGAKLPKTVTFKLVDFNFNVNMSYVSGQYELQGTHKQRARKMESLRIKFPSEERERILSLAPYHRAYQDHLSLKSKAEQQRAKAFRKQQIAQQQLNQRNQAIQKHKNTLAAQSTKIEDAIQQNDWKSALKLQKELISLMQSSWVNPPSKQSLITAYEKLVDYASEAGDFDEVTSAMELHKKAKGE